MAKAIKQSGYWTQEELDILISKYSAYGRKGLEPLLPNRTRQGIGDKAIKLGLVCSKEARCEHNFNHLDISQFTESKTPKSVYVLGLLWADGHLCKVKPRRARYISISLVSTDFSEVKPIFESTAEWKFYHREQRGHSKPATTGVLTDRRMHDFLLVNDYQIKSITTPTKILSTIPEDLVHYFWRGYFDGDGNIDAKKHSVTMAGSLNQDWTDYAALLNRLEIRHKVSRWESNHGNSSDVRFYSMSQIVRFSQYIYQGEQFGLVRKRDKFAEIESKFLA